MLQEARASSEIENILTTNYELFKGETVIRDKLRELENFMHAEDGPSGSLDMLVKLALVHYQFEAIHPFQDGNGRTGRILDILYLVDRRLLNLPVLHLSRYIIDHSRSSASPDARSSSWRVPAWARARPARSTCANWSGWASFTARRSGARSTSSTAPCSSC